MENSDYPAEHPLDGRYQITTTTDYRGPLQKKSDGQTEIKESQTRRHDDANCLWVSTFEVISESEVRMTSVADPAEADVDFLLLKPDGSPTREPVTYTTTLKLARKGDRIQMSGQINYGNELIFITLRKI